MRRATGVGWVSTASRMAEKSVTGGCGSGGGASMIAGQRGGGEANFGWKSFCLLLARADFWVGGWGGVGDFRRRVVDDWGDR